MTTPLDRVAKVYREYPRQFWVLIIALFIDRLGGALIFPFLTLYVTQKFNVGMTEVGAIFGMFSLTSIFGSMIGGALSDRIGRKTMLIFGLVFSALSSLLMGLVDSFTLFLFSALIVGLLANVAGPAQQAMVADLLPEKQRAEGFGILRVAANLAVTIGPAIGGLLAGKSYLLLFICDGVFSIITALIVALAVRETLPEKSKEQAQESMLQTFQGYGVALKDTTFVAFIGACILMSLVYMQMNTTLAVYLRDHHNITPQYFGYIISMNAGMVVLMQFSITRIIKQYPPLLMMALGTLLYALGFSMYGFVTTYLLFLAAMAIITIGEMLVSPTSQALAARFSPEDMRGRYMAVFGFSWVIPSTIGPILAGVILDNANRPEWLWYVAGFIGLSATAAFLRLHTKVHFAHIETEEPAITGG
ncbi:MAG: MFS transporter [Anaerolineae bacterium]|nr:MFS transporter [Anaerolineae bacterium]